MLPINRAALTSGLLTSCLLLSGCQKEVFPGPFSDDPVGNFEAFWSEFDQLYGLFHRKNLDWDEVYDRYRPEIHPETTDADLYAVLTAILEELDDGHTGLVPVGTDLPQYVGGPLGRIDTVRDFHPDVVTGYLPEGYTETEFAFRYGLLTDAIGYLHINGFAAGARAFDKEMEPVLAALRETEGIVLDLRGGYGGEDIAAQTVASYFTDEDRLFMYNRVRNGPQRDNLTDPVAWWIRPRTDRPLLQPLVVLTNRQTISAREVFLLAVATRPQVTTVGDTTAGAFSNNLLRELPNGWAYSLSIGDWYAADGRSYEGVGIVPDVLVRNRAEALRGGRDRALETAIELLRR